MRRYGGVGEIDKCFIIFAIKKIGRDIEDVTMVEDINAYIGITEGVLEELNKNGCYLITQFTTHYIDIDFCNPKEAMTRIEEITANISEVCPVAKYFGVTGNGEGAVWKSVGHQYPSFKVTGPKLAVTKMASPAELDPVKAASVTEFVSRVVTDVRLAQGIDYLNEMSIDITIKNTAAYIAWVVNDILSEEGVVLHKSALTSDDVKRPISKAARIYWLDVLSNS